jgi:flagellar motor protein MotB
MFRRRHQHDGASDFWPVVADSFISILAVYIFITVYNAPTDGRREAYKRLLEENLKSEKASGFIDEFRIGNADARIVYSDQALSFKSCEWDLPPANAERIRSHLRWFGKQPQFIARIQIEGHADRRSAESCQSVQPFRDNLQLSQNRARAIYNVLLGLEPTDRYGLVHVLHHDGTIPPPPGLDFIRVLNDSGQVQTAGFGDTVPRDRADSTSAKNRRVEIRIVFVDKTKVTGVGAEALAAVPGSR